jgi:hypothetical protein
MIQVVVPGQARQHGAVKVAAGFVLGTAKAQIGNRARHQPQIKRQITKQNRPRIFPRVWRSAWELFQRGSRYATAEKSQDAIRAALRAARRAFVCRRFMLDSRERPGRLRRS